jgi:uncharacterized protein (TIGR02001 family)
MKKTTLALAMGLMISGAVNAAVEANIGFTTDYIWRGNSQTNGDPTLQGGVDYSNESGVYLGAWASDVKWVDGYELDVYGGYAGETVGGIGYDVGFIHYAYPDATNSDFTEIAGSLALGAITAGMAHTFSADTDSQEGDNYYSLSATTEISEGLSLTGTVGYFDFDAGTSYKFGQIDLTQSLGDKGDLTVSLVKANDDGYGVYTEDATLLASWTMSF